MTIDWTQLVAPGYTSDYEMLFDMRITKKMSYYDMEELLGVSHNTIVRRCKALGIASERPRKNQEGLQLPSSVGMASNPGDTERN